MRMQKQPLLYTQNGTGKKNFVLRFLFSTVMEMFIILIQASFVVVEYIQPCSHIF